MDDGLAGRDWTWFITPSGPIARDWVNVENGLIPLSELDDMEISRIQLRDNNGQFRGRKPFVSRKITTEFRRELQRRYDLRIQEAVLSAHDTMVNAMSSDTATWTEKMKAATYLIERAVGKVPDKVEVTAEIRPWEGIVMGILTDVGEVEEQEGSDEMKEIEG